MVHDTGPKGFSAKKINRQLYRGFKKEHLKIVFMTHSLQYSFNCLRKSAIKSYLKTQTVKMLGRNSLVLLLGTRPTAPPPFFMKNR